MKKSRIGNILFILCISILSLICLAFIAEGFSELRYSISSGSHYHEDDYTSALKYNEYSYLYYITLNDKTDSKKLSSKTVACRAVAYYYEAAILYKAYLSDNNNAAAQKQLQRMNDYASQCEIYQESLSDIQKLLKLSSEKV